MSQKTPYFYVLTPSRNTLENYDKRERYIPDFSLGNDPDTALSRLVNATNFVCADHGFHTLYLRDQGLVKQIGSKLSAWPQQLENPETAIIFENDGMFTGESGFDLIVLNRDKTISTLTQDGLVVSSSIYTSRSVKDFVHKTSIPEINTSLVQKEIVGFPTQKHFLTIACDKENTYIVFYRIGSSEYATNKWKAEYKPFGQSITINGETFKKAIGMSPDSQYLYYINGGDRLVKLNVTTGKRDLVSTLIFQNVERGKVLRNKPYVFMETPEYCVMFDAAADSVVYSITNVSAADVTTDGTILIAAYQGRLMKFDGLTGEYLGEHTFSGGNPMSKYRINEVDKPRASYIDKNGNWCVVGDDHIKVFNKTEKKELKIFPLPQEGMHTIQVLDNGRIVSGYNWSNDSIIIFYPDASGKTRLYPIYKEGSYTFSDQGNYFLSRHPKSDSIAVINLTAVTPAQYAVIPEIKGKNYFHGRMLEAEMKVVAHGYGKYYGFNLNSNAQFEVTEQNINPLFLGLVKDHEASEDSRSAANLGVYRIIDNPKINNVMQYGILMFGNMKDSSVIFHICHNSHLISWSMSQDGKLLTTTGDEYYTGEYVRSKIWRVDKDAAGHLSFTLLDSIGLYKPREKTIESVEVVNPINKFGPTTITRTVLGLSPNKHTADIEIIDYYENGILISSQADAYRTQTTWYKLKGDDRRIIDLAYPVPVPLNDGTTAYVRKKIEIASFGGEYYFQ